MSFKAMTAVMHCYENGVSLDPEEFALMISLANYADDDGESFPRLRLLEKCSRLQRRTLQRRAGALQERGLLEIEERRGRNDARVSNIYRLNLPRLTGVAVNADPQDAGEDVPLFPDRKATDRAGSTRTETEGKETPPGSGVDPGACTAVPGGSLIGSKDTPPPCQPDTPPRVTQTPPPCHTDTPPPQILDVSPDAAGANGKGANVNLSDEPVSTLLLPSVQRGGGGIETGGEEKTGTTPEGLKKALCCRGITPGVAGNIVGRVDPETVARKLLEFDAAVSRKARIGPGVLVDVLLNGGEIELPNPPKMPNPLRVFEVQCPKCGESDYYSGESREKLIGIVPTCRRCFWKVNVGQEVPGDSLIHQVVA